MVDFMNLPLVLPPWVPWWVPLALLVPALLYGLALLVMPFSVIGVKGRLEALDARLDDIQDDLRRLAMRLPEPAGRRGFEDIGYTPPVFPGSDPPLRAGEPASVDHAPADYMPRRREPERTGTRPTRAEPRLDRPR